MTIETKICGIKTQDALDASLQGGARYVGLNFYEPSPRYVSLDQAARLRDRIPSDVTVVALTVDLDDVALRAIVDGLHPDMLQLHGAESFDRFRLCR